jgi:hypothetical protein
VAFTRKMDTSLDFVLRDATGTERIRYNQTAGNPRSPLPPRPPADRKRGIDVAAAAPSGGAAR